jgi:hypothetical protein
MSLPVTYFPEVPESVTLTHWGCFFSVAVRGIPIIHGLGLKTLALKHSFMIFLVKSVTLIFEGLDAEGARLYLAIFENVAIDLAKPRPGR